MNRDLMLRAGKYKKRRKLRHLWKRIVSALGCVVVFCTTYALILPAVTQERESFFGIEAHIHAQECLVQGSEIDHYELMCSYETLGVHQHDDACYDDQKNLICTEIDYLIHIHNETCYREDGKFACMIPEVPPHEHTQECYQLLGGHVHGEECYAFTRGALTCTLPEEEAHTHQEDCWIFGEQLLCGVESEHVHGSEC